MVVKFKNEVDIYPVLTKELEGQGFFVQRVEQQALPDFWVIGINGAYWMEVKLYKGIKPLSAIVLNDLKWRPGQRKFMCDVRRKQKEAHFVMVFNKEGQRRIM